MDVASMIRANRDALSPAERRVADLVLTDPHSVAFGTVAEVALAAGTSGGSVVRFTVRLGLDGFADLQDRVQTDLTQDRNQAAERIRTQPTDDRSVHQHVQRLDRQRAEGRDRQGDDPTVEAVERHRVIVAHEAFDTLRSSLAV